MVLDAGRLYFTIEFGRNLKKRDILGRMDPYCIVKCGGLERRTETHHRGGRDPMWNQTFAFPILSDNTVEIEILDEDTCWDDRIGRCQVDLSGVRVLGKVREQVPIFSSKTHKQYGYICISMNFVSNRPVEKPSEQTMAWAIQAAALVAPHLMDPQTAHGFHTHQAVAGVPPPATGHSAAFPAYGTPPIASGPNYTGIPPIAPGPSYTGIPPIAPGPSYTGAPPIAAGPKYTGAPPPFPPHVAGFAPPSAPPQAAAAPPKTAPSDADSEHKRSRVKIKLDFPFMHGRKDAKAQTKDQQAQQKAHQQQAAAAQATAATAQAAAMGGGQQPAYPTMPAVAGAWTVPGGNGHWGAPVQTPWNQGATPSMFNMWAA